MGLLDRKPARNHNRMTQENQIPHPAESMCVFSEHPEMLSNVDYPGCKEILLDLKE